jgi:uncharacterized Zn finger protein
VPCRQDIAQALAESLRIAAGLMAGETPPEIEPAFADARLRLFLQRAGELTSNPCKHVAVYYLLAEEIDSYPFLLIRSRGIEREEIVQQVVAALMVRAKASIAGDLDKTCRQTPLRSCGEG